MSLVLDALKKLERDKEARAPGVLVVGAVPWQGARRHRAPFLALAGVALLALGALALGVWWLNRTPAAGQAPPATPAPAASASVPAPQRAATTTPSAPPERRLTLPAPGTEGGAAAARPAPSPPGGPQLNAISRQDGLPVAVIDGRLVREGDSVGGVRILRIGETEVEIEVHGQRRTLRF